jgi:predicted transcriptional regulator
LGEWLAKNTLTNSSERSALLKILKKQPQAFQDIADYIKSIETKLIK